MPKVSGQPVRIVNKEDAKPSLGRSIPEEPSAGRFRRGPLNPLSLNTISGSTLRPSYLAPMPSAAILLSMVFSYS